MIPNIKKEAVLSMYQQGQKYNEIAESLFLSPNTVKSICRRSGIKPIQMDKPGHERCRNCGVPLRHSPGSKPKTFCSDRCRYTWWNRRRKLQPHHLVCSYCGRRFISYGNKKRKFCGRECYLLSRHGEGLP